ncbi:MAG: DUF4234 domain-containing protein [Ruminococcus sp.]|nr:DUF4234 domain-containing protein [Ruminococcus sp.]
MENGIQKRDLVKAIIFTIITCGIYGIYWFIKITDETNHIVGDANGTNGTTAFILTLVTCGIYGYFWAYKQGEKIEAAKSAKGLPPSNLPVLYLILEIVGLGIVNFALMQNELNSLIDG